MTEHSTEQTTWNFEQYVKLIAKLEDENIVRMIEDISHRLATSPANAQKDEYGCYPGGLIQTTLDVLEAMRKIDIVAGKLANTRSLFKVALLHSIGTMGTVDKEMFIEQDSDWHIEKLGLLFKRQSGFNTSSTERTLQFLFHYGVELSSEEFFAIISTDKDKPLNYLGKILCAARTVVCT